jgi:DNA-binding GntR family transcriptional regulator
MSSPRQTAVLPPAGRKAEAAQDAVFRWLKQHIVTLPRRDGVFLTEAEVCRATGTSRTPVREALLRLEADGFLQIVPKKGAYVAPITEADIEAVMQARKLVEEWCVRQAAALGETLARELDQFIDQQAELMDDPVAFIESDRLFHHAIVSAAGNPVLAGFYESLRDRQLRMGVHAVATSDRRSGDVLGEHKAIVAGIRAGDSDVAAAAVARHLATTLAALRMPIIRPLERRFQT